MKTKKLLILLVVLFMPFMVNAKTCDTSKITIDSINLDSKSNSVSELSEATANGKNVNLDLSMMKQGDNAVYSIVVKNDSDEDFEIDSNSLGLSSNYVTYTLDAGEDNVVKANSTKTVQLRVEYTKVVPANEYKSGVYKDSKDLVVNLSNGRQILSNPQTGMNILFYTLLIGGLGIGTYIVIRKKKHSLMVILLIGIITIPASVYALCKCELKVNSNVELQRTGFTGVIYRNSEYLLREGESILSTDVWMPYNSDSIKDVNTNELIPERAYYISEEECNSYINGDRSYEKMINTFLPIEKESSIEEYYNACKKVRRTIGDYVLEARDLNKNYYIRDEVKDDIVTKAQVCFYTDKEVCLSPTMPPLQSIIEENVNKLKAEENWFVNHNGTCEISTSKDINSSSYCKNDNLRVTVRAFPRASSQDGYCTAYYCLPYSDEIKAESNDFTLN